MSRYPRNLRRIELERKAGLYSPTAGLMDVQHASNIRQAITMKLDEEERKYDNTQHQQILKIKDSL